MSNAPGPDGVVCAHGCDAWTVGSQCPQHGSPRGFVVMAKRTRVGCTKDVCDCSDVRECGNAYPDDQYEIVKMRGRDTGVVFTGEKALEQAQNAQEYCEKMRPYETYRGPNFDEIPMEYVVGEIVPVGICSQCGKSGMHVCDDDPT